MLFQPFPVTGQSVVLLPGPGDWCGTAPPGQSRSAFIQSLWEALQPPHNSHAAATCALPPATITGPAVLCQDVLSPESFTIVGGASASWTLSNSSGTVITTGSGSAFNHLFTTPGTYRLSATGTSFCPPEDFFIKVIATPAAPDAITGPDRACLNLPIRYDGAAPVPGTSYQWSVAGGSADAGFGDHSYITFTAHPAVITLTRVTTGEKQCFSAPITKTVLEPVPPFAITGADTACHSTEETYSATYEDGDSYEWSLTNPLLGSVVVSNGPEATILWNVPAPAVGVEAVIRLRVSKCGAFYDKYDTVFVRGVPGVDAVSHKRDTICSGEVDTVLVTLSYNLGSASGYTVNWGDGPSVYTAGTPLLAPPPAAPHTYLFTHTYYTDGEGDPVAFTPAITIHEPNGCLGNIAATAPTITVMPRPVAWLSPGGTIYECEPGWNDTLVATVTTGIGGSNSFSWTVPTGASDPGNTPINYNADHAGTYTVVITNSIFGCQSAVNVTISEDCDTIPGCTTPPPTVTLTPNPNFGDCGDIEVLASTTGGSFVSWTYSSGITPAGTPPSTSSVFYGTASVAGFYSVGYKVSYPPGCTFTKHIAVKVPYVPDLRKEITCNQAGGNYNITLYDHSTVYPEYTITSRKYYDESWTLLPAAPDGLTAVTTQTAGTIMTYYQVIQGSSPVTGLAAACTTHVTVEVPDFPTVTLNVTAPYMPGCVEDVVFSFTHDAAPASSITSYWWDFDDDSYNANAGPTIGKVYSNPSGTSPYSPSIKVTDQYGCYAVADTTVEVMPNPYFGNLTVSTNPVCQGLPVTLTYTATGSPAVYPDTFIWYEQTLPVATTIAPVYSYNAFTPGGYWASAIGNYGCRVKTNMVDVKINQVPAVAISGNAGQCVDQPFVLSTQDYGAGYTYAWSGPGAAMGSGPSLTLTHSTPGTFTYTVTITDLATGCTRQSPAFTVTVSTPPAMPVLSFDVLSCQPYLLELTATGVAGTYNWSNGGYGPVITTPHGGPYQVTLTDLNGCRVDTAFNPPNSLEEYLWVFPTGCFCKSVNYTYVIGPIIPLDYWAWLQNGATAATGSGLMPPLTLIPGYTYNMDLANAWCHVVSDGMYYLTDTCSADAPGITGQSRPLETALPANSVNALSVAPNPAAGQAVVTYSFVPGGQVRTVELYDLTGRKLQSHTLDRESGALTLSLSDYAAGLYQVVLKRDGVAVQQSKLSVTR